MMMMMMMMIMKPMIDVVDRMMSCSNRIFCEDGIFFLAASIDNATMAVRSRWASFVG